MPSRSVSLYACMLWTVGLGQSRVNIQNVTYLKEATVYSASDVRR